MNYLECNKICFDMVTPDAWKLYWNTFQEGDEVVLIDEDDMAHTGKLETREDFCVLHVPGKKPKPYEWNKIGFMFHKGLPVRKVMGAAGGKLVKQLDTGNVEAAVRQALTHDLCSKCEKLVPEGPDNYYRGGYIHPKCRQLVVRDPFLIEDVRIQLLNPGNTGPRHWCGDYEEVAILTASDGAKGLLYDLDSFLYADIEGMGRVEAV